jgi:PhnB protein
VLQATLPFGNTLLHISDTLGELNDAASERNAIAVECDPETTKFAFAVLAEEGRIGIPLQKTFFSPCHGVIFDKFGVMWNFISQSEKQ